MKSAPAEKKRRHVANRSCFRVRREHRVTFIGPSIGKIMPESGLDCRICAEFTREWVGRNQVCDTVWKRLAFKTDVLLHPSTLGSREIKRVGRHEVCDDTDPFV